MQYRVNDAKVAWRVVEGEGVLLHADSSAYFGLNQTGTLLWQRLAASPQSASELAEWLQESVSGAPDDPAPVVAQFLEQLSRLDLLDPAAGPASDRNPPPDAGPLLEPGAVVYEPPLITPFGELEKLILSGE
jgi:hypothetical protein